jgi:hypothetical protein
VTGWGRVSPLRAAAAVIAVALAVAVLPAAGISASGKPFSASISPPSAPAGSTLPYSYGITNLAGTQPLGSAHITIPSGWSVDPNSVAASGPAGKTWSADVNPATSQIEVDAQTQGDRLANGQTVTVTFSATVGCAAPTPSPWPIAVKQSNNFLGSGNDFALSGAVPAVAVTKGSGPIASFSVSTSTLIATAGQPFTVTATALDTCGNVKSDYIGPAGLAPTGNLSDSATAPADDNVHPSYGPFGTNGQPGVWTNGSATATVIAKKAETMRTLMVTDGAATGTSTPLFAVVPATFYPTFKNQPSDTQVSTTIYSDVVLQTPVTVSVADVWGNLPPDGTNVSMTGPPSLKGTTPEGTAGGVATFGDLSLGAIGTYQLTAQVGNQPTSSTPFQILTALTVCKNNLNNCSTPTVNSPNGKQSTDTTITSTSGTFFQGNVILKSSFISNPNECAGFNPVAGTVGSEVEVSTTSGNISVSQPTFTITYTVPKATLKAAGLANLGAAQFQLCLGAKRLDLGNTPPTQNMAWTDASGHLATLDPNTGYFWGIVPSASNSLPANNPYIASQHKDGAGNLVIVLVKPYPWDGWGYV